MSKPAKTHVEDWQIVYRTIGLLSAQAVQGRLANCRDSLGIGLRRNQRRVGNSHFRRHG